MKPALLDVNVLLGLAWPNHQFHATAHRWFQRESNKGWATCAMTQLAFIRLSSNPAFASEAVSAVQAAELLQHYCSRPEHRFWESPSAADPALYRHVLGHQQVMDAWIVAAARHHHGRVATFDVRMGAHDPSGKIVEIIPSE